MHSITLASEDPGVIHTRHSCGKMQWLQKRPPGAPLPKTLNSLMKHLRDSGIDINGSGQKRRLKNIGYYHGYKGYRFAGKAANRLPLTDFSQVAALYDFDTQLKALFYSRVMAIETALKNYTLEAVLRDAKSEAFEDIWRKSLTDYRSCTGGTYRKAWEKRQRLRGEIDSIIFYNHKSRDVIGHFRDADKDIPIWAIFEVMTLGNFGSFYECLDRRVKTAIVRDIGMPFNLDSEQRHSSRAPSTPVSLSSSSRRPASARSTSQTSPITLSCLSTSCAAWDSRRRSASSS